MSDQPAKSTSTVGQIPSTQKASEHINEYQKHLVRLWLHDPGKERLPSTNNDVALIFLLAELSHSSESSVRIRFDGIKAAIERYRCELEAADEEKASRGEGQGLDRSDTKG